jgi:hypothetical protein
MNLFLPRQYDKAENGSECCFLVEHRGVKF